MKDPSHQAEKVRKLYIQGCWKGDRQDPQQVPAATETPCMRLQQTEPQLINLDVETQQSLRASEPQHQEDSLLCACSSNLQSRFWALAAHTDRKLCSRKPLSHLCLWQYVKHGVRNRGGSLPQVQRHLCWPNLSPGKVCCLPGVWVLDTMDRLLLRPVVVWPLDYYPQLLFHSGTMDQVPGETRNAPNMTTQFTVCWPKSGSQVVSRSCCWWRGRTEEKQIYPANEQVLVQHLCP